MKPNPFRCPKCGLAACNVDGDPFQQVVDDSDTSLFTPHAMTIAVKCEAGHEWPEHAEFSPPILWEGDVVQKSKIIYRITGGAK